MLSNLKHETFTIINQIPQSASISTKVRWRKSTLHRCDKTDGIYDKTTDTIVRKANTFTAYISEWERFRPANWIGDGYYAMADADKDGFYTANVGDLIIFADIPDVEPVSAAEFSALVQKYKDLGGIISGVNAYINYKPNGEPWKTNHIELVKGG